jgi:hypothetical protein
MVVDRVLKDALKKHRELGDRFVRVFLRQFEHRVLDDVEGGILVAHGEHRLLERSPLDVSQEGRDFLMGGQFGCFRLDSRRL